MASLTAQEAKDVVLDLFKTAWDANTAAIVGSVPPVEWPNGEALNPQPDLFARISNKQIQWRQASLTGGLSTTRWGRDAIVTVQIFAPKGKNTEYGYALADVVKDAFQGVRVGDLWFREVQMREIGVDGRWYNVNVTGRYTFDEIS